MQQLAVVEDKERESHKPRPLISQVYTHTCIHEFYAASQVILPYSTH